MSEPAPSAIVAPTPGAPTKALPPTDLKRILLIDIALPFLTVFVAERQGVAPLYAYMAASFFPILSVALTALRRRSLDMIGLAVVVGIATGLLLGAVTADPRFALVRTGPAFALFGLACLISLATSRPLMFFAARSFAAGGEPSQVTFWNTRLQTVPAFRHRMNRVTLVWGVSALAEACLGIACAFLLPGSVALVAEPLIAVAVLGALFAWTRTQQHRTPAA